jgi:3-deoxy-7-phosphoheptulonate synthase
MVVVMDVHATDAQIDRVVEYLTVRGAAVHRMDGPQNTVLAAIAADPPDEGFLATMDGVGQVLRIPSSYQLASRACRGSGTVIDFGDFAVGDAEVVVMAGPCAVESEEQIFATAAAVRRAGARILRGGAFKPRTSPYNFQGLGRDGLALLRAAADREGLKAVSEVMDASQIDLVSRYVDMLQVGSRNMQNYSLLRELGHTRQPVLLKRGLSATIEEWLLAAEYLLSGGNADVILCERGIRTFEKYTRNTLDLSAVQVVKQLSHLPVIVDPSHGTGRRDQVAPMARAAVAAGADGLIIEVHCDADHAMSDAAQSLYPAQFEELMVDVRMIAAAVRRTIAEAGVASLVI